MQVVEMTPILYKQNKKGQIILVYLMGLIALLAVVSVIFSIAQKAGDSDSVVKAVFAEEVRLAINAMISVPGDGEIQLPQNEAYNITNFTISLKNGFVDISKGDESNIYHARKVFHLPEGYTAAGTVVESTSVYLIKDGKTLRIQDKSNIGIIKQEKEEEPETEEMLVAETEESETVRGSNI